LKPSEIILQREDLLCSWLWPSHSTGCPESIDSCVFKCRQRRSTSASCHRKRSLSRSDPQRRRVRTQDFIAGISSVSALPDLRRSASLIQPPRRTLVRAHVDAPVLRRRSHGSPACRDAIDKVQSSWNSRSEAGESSSCEWLRIDPAERPRMLIGV